LPTVPETRLEITTPPTDSAASLAISPDGRAITFAATDGGRARLWLRSLDAVTARALPGTEGAAFPFWAPHGRTIGFFTDDGKLKRIDLDGGVVRVLADAQLPRGGTWNADDTIVFVPGTGPVYRLSAAGGERTQVTTIGALQSSHSSPQFLPDGSHFLYGVTGSPDVRGIYVAGLDGSASERLVDTNSLRASYSGGHLLFVRGDTLFAQPFDAARRVLNGVPVPVAEGIALQPYLGFQVASFSASPTGHIIFRSGVVSEDRQFVWFDRSGREMARIGSPDGASPLSPAMSPDGRHVAMHRTTEGNIDLWLLDLERGGLRRLTTHATNEIHPLWSPDGNRLVFSSNSTGSYELYERSILGASAEKKLLPMQGPPTDWSPDSRFLLFHHRGSKSSADIWVLPYGSDQKPYPLVQTEFEERDAQFSPDGKWIAYASVESGRPEIYVQPFPGPGVPASISIDGGAQPRWRRDGKELFFIALDDRLMAVPIALPSGGGSVKAGAPVALFATRVGGAFGGVANVSRQQYSVSPDGSRFLMNTLLEGPAASPITLILNWQPRPQDSGK
jgi:Tol biopolymer transport system component